MKRHIFLILITLLLIATALKAGAEASKDENLSRYLGAWVSEEYRLYIRIFSFDHYYDRNALAEFVNSLY